MNIKITIDAPELAGAIESLAAALNTMSFPLTATAPTADVKQEDTKVIDKPEQDKPKQETKNQDAPAQENKKADPVKEEPKEDSKEEQLISLEVVRGKLADFSAKGRENQVKVMDALSRFGVKKLTEVEPSDYKELLELVGLSV